MDLGVVCTSSANLGTMLGMALPVLVIVSMGIPIGSALFLRSIGPQYLQQAQWMNLLGFLINGYQPELYFWESMVLLRKVFLAFVTTTLAPAGAGMQITTTLIVLLLALVLHARFHPYTSGIINALESFALVTASLTLVGGIYVVLEDGNLAGTAAGIAGPSASVMIAVINVLFFASALTLLSKTARQALYRIHRRTVVSLRRAVGAEEDLTVAQRAIFGAEVMLRRASRRSSVSPTRGPQIATPLGDSFSQANPLQRSHLRE
jgi:hypothetical protein